MSRESLPLPYTIASNLPPAAQAAPKRATRSFVHHAKLISILTLLSRILGVLRESLAAKYFGAGLVSTAFAVAFTIPNLFRKLLGEGALSVAFIPLYAQSIKSKSLEEANQFAAASVKLLGIILLGITVIGEMILLIVGKTLPLAADRLLTLQLTAVMLPFVIFICGVAFLSGMLQVHKRFGLPAATPIVMNLGLIAGTILAARLWNTKDMSGQIHAVFFIAVVVLIAGAAQLLLLIPSLRAIGFGLDLRTPIWTPQVRTMLRLSVPVALGAVVLQISVLLDRGISLLFAQSMSSNGMLQQNFHWLGHAVRYPMEFGAAARLNWAQFLYQFPLGVFAIALATAIFPTLSADALDADRSKFLDGLRRGIRLSLWEGLPASIGLFLVAEPAVQLLFERGSFTAHDTQLVAASVRVYALGIWAFSLLQILSRAYYAMHDTITPLKLSIVTLIINLIVEIPLLWTGLAESAMAVGTTISFAIQAILMLWILQRKVGSLQLSSIRGYVLRLLTATAAMSIACILIQRLPFFPTGHARTFALLRLTLLIGCGGVTYFITCALLGISIGRPNPRRSSRLDSES